MRIYQAQVDAIARDIESKKEKKNKEAIRKMAKSQNIQEKAKLVVNLQKQVNKINKRIKYLTNDCLNYRSTNTVSGIASAIAEDKLRLDKGYNYRKNLKNKIVLASIDSNNLDEIRKKVL